MRNGFSAVFVLIGALLVVVVAAGVFYYYLAQAEQKKLNAIISFEECGKYYPIMESYPAQCNTPDGRHFVQELSEEEKKKLIPPY